MQREESEGSHAACLPGWLRPTWSAAWLARVRATGRGRNANQTNESTLLSASLQTAVLLATAEGDAAGALHTREMSDTAGSRTEAQILDAIIADDAVRQLHSEDIERYRQQTGIEDYESVYNALEAVSWDVALAVCDFWDSLAVPASPLQPATHVHAGSRTEAQILDATIADDAVRQLHSQDIEQYRQLTGIEDYDSVYNALKAASWDVAVAVCVFWDSLAAPASPLQPATHKAGACQHTSSYVSIRQLLRKCGALSSSSCACLLC